MPQNSIVEVAEGMWAINGWTRLAPGVHFPARTTLVRLSTGGLLMHSPIDFTAEELVQIGKLGEVSHLMAPNLYHHLFLKSAQAHFPHSKTIAPAGLSEKVKDLNVDGTLDTSLPFDLSEDFDLISVKGSPRFSEALLLHRASRSLIVGDYFFNIRETRGLLAPLALMMTGSHKKATQSRLWRSVTENKTLMKESAREVLEWDFQRIIMCHGDVLDEGREVAERSLAWLSD